jgi:hypothetical protein
MPGLTARRIGLDCGNSGGIGSAPELFGQGLTDAGNPPRMSCA